MAISFIGISFVVACVVYNVFNRIIAYRRLSHFPGPRLAQWSRLWLVKTNSSGRNHEICYEVNRDYGSIARIGPNHLLTSDPELMRRMQAPKSPYCRSVWYTTFRFKPRSDNLISVTSEERHDELRRKMAAGYSGKEVPNVEAVVDRHVESWINLIKKKYLSSGSATKPMDLGRTSQFFTLDAISDLAFNRPFGDLVEDRDKYEYVKTTEDAVRFMTVLSIFPHVHRWIEQSRLVDLLAPDAKDKSGLGRVVGIAQEMVAERFKGEKDDRQDMLGSFVRHGLTQSEAESEAVLQIMAGSDTTATVIRVAFLYILTNPIMLAKLRAEIDSGIREGRVSSPIRDIEARKLPYLQACIKETLRLWPPITGLLQKVVPAEGDTIDGKFIPGGTFIGHNTWALGRNSSIYGPDFALFRPERWLHETDSTTLAKMERNAELTFGYGRFKCLGQPVAQVELNKVFVELLRRFDMTIVNPAKPWESESRGFFMQKNFFVNVTEREGGAL